MYLGDAVRERARGARVDGRRVSTPDRHRARVRKVRPADRARPLQPARLITGRDGVQSLVFRMANARRNQIVEAHARVVAGPTRDDGRGRAPAPPPRPGARPERIADLRADVGGRPSDHGDEPARRRHARPARRVGRRDRRLGRRDRRHAVPDGARTLVLRRERDRLGTASSRTCSGPPDGRRQIDYTRSSISSSTSRRSSARCRAPDGSPSR